MEDFSKYKQIGKGGPKVAKGPTKGDLKSGILPPGFLEELGSKRLSNGGKKLLQLALDADAYYGDNDLAADVIRSKYLAPGETGPLHLWDRIARAIASVETDGDYWYKKFLSILMDFKFVPGGRVMHGAGREDARRRPSLSNCYVIPIASGFREGTPFAVQRLVRAVWDQKVPIEDYVDNAPDEELGEILSYLHSGQKAAGREQEKVTIQDRMKAADEIISGYAAIKEKCHLYDADSLEGIYNCLSESAMVYRTGGGVGTDLSILRPEGAPVNATVDQSPGATKFMNLFSESTNTVSQAGRRGALMLTLRVDHPDLEKFITIKNDPSRTKVQHANVSVLITHEFMDAVLNDKDFDLRWGGRVFKTVKARDLWDKIIKNAYDSAEPGLIFWDTMREYHNVEYANPLTSTNPCVTADTRLHTQFGMVRVGELFNSGEPLEVTVDNRALRSGLRGTETRPAVPVFMTSSSADVYRVETDAGYEIKATEWHEFYTGRGKIKLKDLQVGDELLIQSGKGQFGKQGSPELGTLLGLITGDGHFTNRGNSQEAAVINLWNDAQQFANAATDYVNAMIAGAAHRSRNYQVTPVAVPSRNLTMIRSVLLARVLENYGFTGETKLRVPEVIWQGTEGCVRAYLRALFETDGTVNVSDKSQGCSIRLTSSYPELLKDIQILLSNFGIFCTIRKRRDAKKRLLPDSRRGKRLYSCKASYEIIVDGESRNRFMQEIGFMGEAKNRRYYNWAQGRALRKTQPFRSKIKSITYVGKEPVFDTTQADHNALILNGLATGNCAEQPLASLTACNLGNINLAKFVREDGSFDYEELKEDVRIATRFMDDVIDYNMGNHALPKIKYAVASDRRIGLGITALADALVLMRVKYDTPEALSVAEEIMKTICHTAYNASVDIAIEKGAFPLFKWEGFSKSKFIQSLPEELRQRIKEHGIRNSTVITVPPVGTGSIVAQCSSGIEPIFCTSYKRRVRNPDGDTFSEYKVYHPLIKKLFGDDESLPDYVVTAHQIDPYFRVKMQGVIQKYVDSSISSTINLPHDIPVKTVADIYITAYKEGLKGVTVYREGSREGILETEEHAKKREAQTQAGDATLSGSEGDSPRPGYHPRKRPPITYGVTERIRTGEGNLYVTINEDSYGLCEVFTTIGKAGGQAAAQSEAIARLISLALRSGIDPREIIKELKGISGPAPVWENGELILSTPDAIGRVLERHLERKEKGLDRQQEMKFPYPSITSAREVAAENQGEASSSAPRNDIGALIVTCPDCGGPVVHETGCLTCPHCGWTRC